MLPQIKIAVTDASKQIFGFKIIKKPKVKTKIVNIIVIVFFIISPYELFYKKIHSIITKVGLFLKKLKIEKSLKKAVWNLSGKDIVDEILLSPHIEIFGDSKIEIEGCEGVFEYNSDYLKLKIIKGTVLICGSNFEILTYENKQLTAKGKIVSIEYCV